MKAKVGQVRVTIGISRCDGTTSEARCTEVVGIVAGVCAINVVVISGLESVRCSASVDCGFVDAAEGLVSGEALAYVKGVKRQVSAVVEWKEPGIDRELSILCCDPKTGLDALGKRRDVCWREGGERSTWKTRSVSRGA